MNTNNDPESKARGERIMHDGMVLTKVFDDWQAECACGKQFLGSQLTAVHGWMSHWHDERGQSRSLLVEQHDLSRNSP